MSWFSSNYDKALLGGGALISVGVLYFGWSQLQSSGDDFGGPGPIGGGPVNAAVEGAEEIAQASQSMELDHGWKKNITVEGRSVDLFTGIPLFIKRDSGGRPLDLLKGDPVHPPITNEFWIKYGVDPGFADAPLRDPDADGFTNLEEFRAGTDPTDIDDHPPLIAKLQYVEDEGITWVLKPGFLTQKGEMPVEYKEFKEGANLLTNKRGAGNPVKPGDIFFGVGAAQGRFKYLGSVEVKRMNEAINMQETIKMAQIEDQKPNKAGKVYQIPAPLKQGQLLEFAQHDRSAVLLLKALGENGNRMVIEENTRFSLPAGQEEKPYLLKSVTPQQIEVELTDANGNTVPITIKKGAMPTALPPL